MIGIRPNKALILALSLVFVGVALFAKTKGSLKLYPLALWNCGATFSTWK